MVEIQFEMIRAMIILFINSGCSIDEAISSLEYLRNDLIKLKCKYKTDGDIVGTNENF